MSGDSETTTIRPFHTPYTMVYNGLYDHLLPLLSDKAWKVLSVVLRQTIGWQDNSTASKRREEVQMSYSWLRQLLGGGSYKTIKRAVNELVDMGILVLVDKTTGEVFTGEEGERVGRTVVFRLNMDFEFEVEDSQTSTPCVEVQKNGKTSTSTPAVEVTSTPCVEVSAQTSTPCVDKERKTLKKDSKENKYSDENFEEDSLEAANAVSADAEMAGKPNGKSDITPESSEGAEPKLESKKPSKGTGRRKTKSSGDPYQIFGKLKRIVKNDGLPEGPSLKAIKLMLDDGYTPGDILNCAAYLMTADWIAGNPTVVVDGYFIRKRIGPWVSDGKPKKFVNNGNGRPNRAAQITSEEEFMRLAEEEMQP